MTYLSQTVRIAKKHSLILLFEMTDFEKNHLTFVFGNAVYSSKNTINQCVIKNDVFSIANFPILERRENVSYLSPSNIFLGLILLSNIVQVESIPLSCFGMQIGRLIEQPSSETQWLRFRQIGNSFRDPAHHHFAEQLASPTLTRAGR
jgi:hypothetical protein